MDALSIAAAVIQFIDFASSLIGKGIEIHASATGRTVGHDDLESITNSLVQCSSEIGQPKQHQPNLSRTERELQGIAASCQDIAQELLDVLARLKSRGRKTKWESFRRLLQTSWHEGKIQTLETRLDRFRQQMVMNVLNSLRNQSNRSIQEQVSIRESIQRIEERQRNSISVGDRFVRQLQVIDGDQWKRDIIQAIREQEPGQEHGIRLASISDCHGQTPAAIVIREERIRKQILLKLAFRNISDRERRITRAHERTYEWIFSDREHGSMPASSSFKRFLQLPDEKLYWITGKPGSGKSTLMKFIRHHTQTTEILESWAGDDAIIQAAFYFWNSGSRMQMTVEGLLQTLLHQCLQQLPWAIQDVLPKRWEIATLFDVDESPWALDETAQALQILFSEVCPNKKFFLIIDGLDECSGDQTQLIELIAKLAEESENLKLCVASRPWPNFEDAFRDRPSLLLQDLTKDDIEHYIASKFGANLGFAELQVRNPEASEKLLNDVCIKAEGVFLWVQLVVQSLLEGLTNGDRVRDLQRRLAELPPNLEDLYAKILEHLNVKYLEHASQLFQIVRACDDSPTLLCIAFADAEDDQQALKAPIRPLSDTEISALCKNMKRKLSSRCLGLLGISSSNNTVNCDQEDAIDRLEVQYLHRSVRDYIEGPEVWRWLTSANKDPFDPHFALFKANLLQLKHAERELSTSRFSFLVLTAIKYARRSLDAREYSILEKEKAIVQLLDELDKTGVSLTTPNGDFSQVFNDRCGTLHGEHWSSFLILRAQQPSFLHLMAICGVSQYLNRRLSRSNYKDADKDDGPTPLILTALDGDLAIPDAPKYPTFPCPDIKVLRILLNKGARCHQKWGGTSAWILAEKSKETRVLDLFRRHGEKPTLSSNDTETQNGGHLRGRSGTDESFDESGDGSDAESTTSTDVVFHRASSNRRSDDHEYSVPRHHVPRPEPSPAQFAYSQRPPIWQPAYHYAPPRRVQQYSNPFNQPQFRYNAYDDFPYLRHGQQYHELAASPDLPYNL